MFFLVGALTGPDAHAQNRTFPADSLIIPMDLAYQDSGMFQAYGLLFQLLRQGVPVSWVIDQDKTWHNAPCNTPGDECPWDCAVEGSGTKCDYPTASPDFFAETRVLWDSEGQSNPGDVISEHGYRSGPFVIAAAHRAAAIPIIDAWNDQSLWGSAPWAMRTEFNVVTVHETTAEFTGWVRKEMVAAPTIAVFSDGNEDIATGYLRAAGIPQSNGSEFPPNKCGADDCGPGTANPDMLTVPSIMGDMGTCDNVNYDHKNGSLFTPDGLPAYCQIMSMHWGVNDRETVECDGGGCPATEAECSGEAITYHGHEVVAEVRKFLEYPVHFFAECQAVNAYENTSPNPAWPYLDDDGRNGHFLTTTGNPPACPCTDGDFECVVDGCGAGADCCLPSNNKELGAGFLIAERPDETMLQILHPEVPYNQFEGFFQTRGGSEPAYNLSSYLGTEYQNDREVTFITGPNGPGDQDVWMTGYIDGECAIVGNDDVGLPNGECTGGKVSYLGAHEYTPTPPLSGNPDGQGARLFLNALFEADCVTSIGQPDLQPNVVNYIFAATEVPTEKIMWHGYINSGRGMALDSVMTMTIPDGVEVLDSANGTVMGDVIEWNIGSISADPALAGDPPSSEIYELSLRFADFGVYQSTSTIRYRVGQSWLETAPLTVELRVMRDSDGDGVHDDDDPEPDDPSRCGDLDMDTCDDCSRGPQDIFNDGPDQDGNGICDAGQNMLDGDPEGCGCRASSPAQLAPWLLLGLFLYLRRRRSKVSA